jgi:hypothetical protein
LFDRRLQLDHGAELLQLGLISGQVGAFRDFLVEPLQQLAEIGHGAAVTRCRNFERLQSRPVFLHLFALLRKQRVDLRFEPREVRLRLGEADMFIPRLDDDAVEVLQRYAEFIGLGLEFRKERRQDHRAAHHPQRVIALRHHDGRRFAAHALHHAQHLREAGPVLIQLQADLGFLAGQFLDLAFGPCQFPLRFLNVLRRHDQL